MSSLTDELRKQLARVIQDARRAAEPAARQALEALAVHRARPHEPMTPDRQRLRNRLRAHGRQLGDVRDRSQGTQGIGRLACEVAYEYWHRMLFARFLAENYLLIEPDSAVAISMAECEELAREADEEPWTLACRFAERMLPAIFRPDDPALEVSLAPEARQALERLLASLPASVFTATDALGWTYQFWQEEESDEINEREIKIGADELAPATQRFTERYMVLFLLHNTIGAWHAGKVLAERADLAANAQSEEELRRGVSLGAQGGYDFNYLRFVRQPRDGDEQGQPTGQWRPAAGIFEGWPIRAAALRVLDPCCGSGHFLVEGLQLLVRLRMEEEGLGLEAALRAVLVDNLFGLELDARCTQIAAFNVALAAWKLAGRPLELPQLHIACTGLATAATKNEWLALAGDDQGLRGGMDRLYDLFEKAPELGSLIDPRVLTRDSRTPDLYVAEFVDLEPLLTQALRRSAADDEQAERAVAAHGMARAAELLARQYTLVITNVPYLGRGDHSHVLKVFGDERHTDARANLATIFVSRILGWLGRGATAAVVTPQDWLFLTSYRKLREKLLVTCTWHLVVNLGPAAFRDMNWWGAKTALTVLSVNVPAGDHALTGIDLSGHRVTAEKGLLLRGKTARCMGTGGAAQAKLKAVGTLEGDASVEQGNAAGATAVDAPAEGSLRLVLQTEQLRNPDARVTLQSTANQPMVGQFARAFQGLKTGDDERFRRGFWELADSNARWRFYQTTVRATACWGGLHYRVDARDGDKEWARPQGKSAWGREGVAVSQMSDLPVALYSGAIFDSNMSSLVPFDATHTTALWCMCSDDSFAGIVRSLDRSLKVPNGSFEKIPFDLDRWQKIAAEKYPDGLPEPQSDDPTQWVFHGHPAKTEAGAVLQVAVARLLGYRWPPEHDLKMRLAAEVRAWVQRCRDLETLGDRGGIVCLSALRGEISAVDRLRRFLAAAFGPDWSVAKERELLAAAAGDDKPVVSLEDWLRDSFFEEHCKLFHHRPFIWHIWDGRKDGFHALVNYHRLAGPNDEGRRTLAALAYSYLGDWIERQKAEQRDGKEAADARLAAAQDLQAQLERIMVGEPPCDLFVRWKPLQQQPIGWEPDINDGVELNIRPFLSVELRTGGRRGSGILRWRPNNINWNKGKGKEPQSLRPKEEFPWFWRCPGEGSMEERTDFRGGSEFDGNRWNDLHYRNATKRAARERAGAGAGRV